MIIDIVFYTLIGYLTMPFVGYLILRSYPSKKSDQIEKQNPYIETIGISIIIPCFNEEKYIENKINEILALKLNYFELIIISDGSTDSTNILLDQYLSNSNIKIFKFIERGGKPSALNFGVLRSKYDILVFSDVRQLIKMGSFNALISNFSDPRVGAVSAIIDHKGSSEFRNRINYLKLLENKTGSTIGVYGALYAIRKENYLAIPIDTILDDLLISLNVLNQGKLVKLEPEAIVLDIDVGNFYNRKRTLRLIRGLRQLAFINYQVIVKLSARNIFLLFAQKYFKLTLPAIFIALPILAALSDGIYSVKFLTISILWVALVIIFFVFDKKKSYAFIPRQVYYYLLSFKRNKKRDRVLWEK